MYPSPQKSDPNPQKPVKSIISNNACHWQRPSQVPAKASSTYRPCCNNQSHIRSHDYMWLPAGRKMANKVSKSIRGHKSTTVVNASWMIGWAPCCANGDYLHWKTFHPHPLRRHFQLLDIHCFTYPHFLGGPPFPEARLRPGLSQLAVSIDMAVFHDPSCPLSPMYTILPHSTICTRYKWI